MKEKSIDDYLAIFQRECKYIYTSFPDVFDRVVKNDMNLDVFEKIVLILKMIEDGKVNQSEASALVGKLSQKLFFQKEAIEAVQEAAKEEAPRGMTWKDFKRSKMT